MIDTGTAAAKFKRQWLCHALDLVLFITSLLFAFDFCTPLLSVYSLNLRRGNDNALLIDGHC